MFSYRFLPLRRYIVHIRQYTCESCPRCVSTRDPDSRYRDCLHLNTVKTTSYKCRGHARALASDLCTTTGWVEHRIVPVTTTSIAGTRATDGLNRVDLQSRLEYIRGLKAGSNIFMVNTSTDINGAFKPRHFWLAQLLPSPKNVSSVVWKTRTTLPPGGLSCRFLLLQNTMV